MWHEGEGTIVYDPYRGHMKRRTNWWCVLEVDREITRYYRWWVKRVYHEELCQPSWDAHVSIIRGERPPPDKMHLWKKYDGMKLKFRYSHDIYRGRKSRTRTDNLGIFWFADVDFEHGINMRKEFGYPYDYGLHLTLGRTYYL